MVNKSIWLNIRHKLYGSASHQVTLFQYKTMDNMFILKNNFSCHKICMQVMGVTKVYNQYCRHYHIFHNSYDIHIVCTLQNRQLISALHVTKTAKLIWVQFLINYFAVTPPVARLWVFDPNSEHGKWPAQAISHVRCCRLYSNSVLAGNQTIV